MLIKATDNQVDYGNLSEKLPKKINYSLEKGKEMNKDWKDNELSLLINNCINIEKNLSDINPCDSRKGARSPKY